MHFMTVITVRNHNDMIMTFKYTNIVSKICIVYLYLIDPITVFFVFAFSDYGKQKGC